MKNRFLLTYLCAILLTAGGLLQASSSSNPTASRVYGDFFSSEVAPMPTLGDIGAFDLTFGSGTGIASLSTIGTQSVANAVQALSDGTYVVLLGDFSNSYLAKFTETGALDLNFGDASSGIHTLSGFKATSSSIVVDAQGRFIVCGSDNIGDSDNPWIRRVNANGSADSSFAWVDGAGWVNDLYGVAQQTSGKIIALGQNRSNLAQVARYNLDGSLDTTFGVSGYIVFDGNGSPARPKSQYSMKDFVVAADDTIFVAYINYSNNHGYLAKFNADGSTNGILADALGSIALTYQDISCVLNSAGNICIVGKIGNDIEIYCYTPTTGAAVTATSTSFASMTIHDTDSDSLFVQYPIATSDGNIIIAGFNATDTKMRIDSVTNAGVLDTKFNGIGTQEFSIAGSSITDSELLGISVAPDGRLYVAGYQTDSGVTTPYVARLYNDLYTTQIPQYPAAVEQGILDLTFGATVIDDVITNQTYAGVVCPINGLYGASLQQKARTVVELESGAQAGNLLVGMDGYTNSSANQTMMLARMSSNGVLDTTFGASSNGFVPLQNTTTSAEKLNAIDEDLSDGSLYVAGTCATGAILRKYTSAGGVLGVETWAGLETTLSTYQGVGVASQYYGSTSRVLLFVDEDGTHGHISGYTTSGSAGAAVLDTTFFNAVGTIPGKISSADFGLHMGPVYGYAVSPTGIIFVAYVNSVSTGNVDVAAIASDGSGLITEFGINGVCANVFGSLGGAITPSNVRLTLDANQDVLVTAVDNAAAHVYVARLDGQTGILDASFGGSGIMYFAITGSTGALSVSQISALNNNELLLTIRDHAANDTMYVARLTAAGALDTTFDSQNEIQAGVLPIQIQNKVAGYNRFVTGLCVQSSTGNVVVAGYEQPGSSSLSTPMVMRVFGQSGTVEVKDYPVQNEVGTIDTNFGTSGAYDLHSLLGLSADAAANVIYIYPSGNAYAGMMLIAVDNGTTTLIARVNVSDMTLDASFGTAGVYTILTDLRGVTTLTVDVQNNVIVGGTAGDTCWAQQISPNATGATPAISFNIPANIKSINQIYQQQSGRYIIVGSSSTRTFPYNFIVAFQDQLTGINTQLQVDTTFNPLANAGGTVVPGAGYYTFAAQSGGIFAFALNNDDTILVAYSDPANTVVADNITISKIKSDGSGSVSGFPVSTAITSDSSSVVRLSIDGSGRIIVGTSNSSGTQVEVGRYSAAGILDTGFGTSGYQTITNVGSAGVTLTDMMETTTNQTILVGYNTAGANGELFVVRLDYTGALDAAWNSITPYIGTDLPGVLTSNIDSIAQANSAAISISGDIYVAGQTATDPLLVKVFGDNYVTALAQQPLEVAAGLVDNTLNSEIHGSASNATALGTSPLSIYLSAQKIYIYQAGDSRPGAAQGAMLIASSDDSSHTFVTKLNADFSRATFGTSGTVDLGTGHANVCDLFVAQDGSIFVTGDDGSAHMWGAHISADGLTVKSLGTSSVQYGLAIRQTTNQRILVAGVGALNYGVIAAFNADESGAINPNALDLSFGNAGYYSTGIASPILDMVVDSLNRIYIAIQVGSSSSIRIQRLLPNGTAIDSSFGSASGITVSGSGLAGGTPIRLALDATNNQLVVAFQNGTSASNTISVYRFATNDTPNGYDIADITISGQVVTISDLLIDTNQDIYVIGSSWSSDLSTFISGLVARLKSTSSTTLAIDNSYGVSGVATLSLGSMTNVNAGALSPDRRIYLVGGDNSGNPYMARVFGNSYYAQDQENIATASIANIDVTLDADDATPVGAIILSGLSGYAAQFVYTFQSGANEGKTLIVFGDGTHVRIGQFNADMQLDTANFNSSGTNHGLTEVRTLQTVNSLTVDANGKIVIAGTTSGGAQQVTRYTSAGVLDLTFSSSLTLTVGTQVGQQKSGRYIVGSAIAGAGTINAYQNTGAADDQTFGPAASNGFWTASVATTQVDGLVIDNKDCIYIVYRDGSNEVWLEKVAANGSGLVSGFNSAGTGIGAGAAIDTGINAAGKAYIAIDNTGTNILVGARTSAGISTQAYACATGATVGSTVAVITDALVTLTDLTGSGTDFVGSACSTTSPRSMSVFRILSTGGVDTGFVASTGVASFTTASFSSPAPTIMNGVAIQPDGRIIMVGTNGSSPAIIRVYGYPYTDLQDAQAPDQAQAGTLDATLPGTAYELNQTGNSTFDTLIAGYTVKRVYEAGNGVMTFVADSGNNTTIFRLLKDLTLDPSFNSTGYKTFTGSHGNTTGLCINANDIFIAGTHSGASWVECMMVSGLATVPAFTTVNLTSASVVMKQSAGSRIILAGKGATNGSLVAYTHAGAIDTTFNIAGSLGHGGTVHGYVDTGIAAPIADMVIDTTNTNLDRVWMVSVNGSGNTVVQTVNANGGSLTTCSGTAIANVNGNNVAIAQDSTGNYIFVAAATTTGFTIARYNILDGSDAGSQISFTTTSSTPTLANIYATSDGKLTLVGNDGSNVVAARTAIDFSALDTTFNGGVAFDAAIGSMVAYDAIIHADDRVMIVGGDGSNPYMGRLFGDTYVSFVQQAPGEGIYGTIDPSWGTAGLENYTAIAGSKGKAIIALSDGSSFLGLDNGSSASNFVHAASDGSVTIIPGFNSPDGYVLDAVGYGNAGTATAIDSEGNVVVAGCASGNYIYVARYTSAGILDTTFNAYNMTTNPSGRNGYLIDAVGYGNAGTSLAIDSHGNILVSGYDHSTSHIYLARYTSAGVLDTSTDSGNVPFNGSQGYVIDAVGYGNWGTSLAIQSDGKIVVAGYASDNHIYVARYTAAGVLDNTFGPGSSGSRPGYVIDAVGYEHGDWNGNSFIGIQSDGKIVVAGYDSDNHIYLARYTTAGVLDTSADGGNEPFNGSQGYVIDAVGIGNYGTYLAIQSDGKIVVSGYASGNNIYVARYTTAGVLDTTTFGSGLGYVIDAIGKGDWGAPLVIQSDGKIVVSGYASGNNIYVARYTTAGVLDTTTFGSGLGYVIDAIGIGDRYSFIAIQSDSKIVVSGYASGNHIYVARYTADGVLNNSTLVSGISAAAPQGVQSMFLDGLGRVVMVGTNATDSGHGWIQRYVAGGAGTIDPAFNSGAYVDFGNNTIATYAVEQSLGRIVVAGFDGTNGVLFALTNAGVVDTTFNSLGADLAHGGTIPGKFSLNGIGNAIYAIVADEYDRLIIAYLNPGTNAIDIARLTASGEVDTTFGTAGIISGAIANADLASSVRVALDVNGNIVVAAHVTTASGSIAVKAYDNGTAASGNGVQVYAELDIYTGSFAPSTLTSIAATDDGYVLVGGNYGSGTWVARIVNVSGAYVLDIDFNPAGLGPVATPGIYTYHDSADGASADVYNDMAIDTQGRLLVIGTETISATWHPTVIRVYDDPGTTELAQALGSLVIGTNDTTFGVNGSGAVNNGVTFYALGATDHTYGQVAQAVALQDDNNIVVALDGANLTSSGASVIAIKMFDVDGLLNSLYGTSGQPVVATPAFANEYVRDMMTFNAAGVNKAILVGYVQNTAQTISTSLVTQYNLTTPGVDTAFGGYDSNPAGFATGDAKEAHVVGRQSFGRIVVGGLDQSGNGVLLGYSSIGKLDRSFGTDGVVTQGTTGIYSHVIDAQNRIVIAFEDGSSNVAVARFLADGTLDLSFGTSGFVVSKIAMVESASNIRVAIDNSNHIVVAAATGTGSSIVINQYAADGSSVLHTITLGNAGTSIGGTSSSVYTIARLLVDQNNKVIVVAADSNPTPQTITIARVLSNLSAIDATFNPSLGYLKYEVGSGTTQAATDAVIHPDGRIIIVGSEN